ncbi:hypothetical protein ACHAPU_007688 [Fusarium lateritium]
MHKPQGVLQVLEAKKKAKRRAREERESLRESGDYLGVQGINPQTGVLDLTSDSGESILSTKTEQKLRRLEARAKHASSAAEKKEAEIEIVKVHLDQDVKKLRNLERTKKELPLPATGKWRRGTHQWSSVQEPDLSPIAQSHRIPSTFSGPQSHQSHDMAEGELIDLSPPLDHKHSDHISRAELLPGTYARETSHSSDTVIKTPHRRSFTNLSPGAIELFENDITFHPSDEHRPEGDLFADSKKKPGSNVEQTKTILPKTKRPEASKEIQTSSVTSTHSKDQRPNHKHFLDESSKEKIEPGGLTSLRSSINDQSSLDHPTITNPTNHSTAPTLGKSGPATAGFHKSTSQENSTLDLTISHKKSVILQATSKPSTTNFLESQCQYTPDLTYHRQALLTRRV